MAALNVPLNIKLHSGQQYVQDHAKKFNVLSCGKRWGKSKWALFRALQKAGNLPNGVVWVIAPTYRQAKQIAWREIMSILPPQMIRRKIETDLLIEIWNGCLIQLIGAEDEDHLRGVKISHVVFDEAAYIKETVWPLIMGQLLGNKESGGADFISSPAKSGRNWFSSFFEEAKKKMDSGDPDWAAFHYTILDNPTLPPADIQRLKDNTPDDVWSLEYMAVESSYAGTMYSEFAYEKHVSTYVNPNENLPTYRGSDWGLNHPTAFLWAKVDKEKNLIYITDEFFRSGLIIQEIVRAVDEKTGATPILWTAMDPSANRRDIITGRSVRDEFARYGLYCVDGDRRGADKGGRGVDIVKMFFKKDMIRINPACKNLIFALRNLQWGDREGDDCTDALRYLLVRLHDLVFNGVLPERAVVDAPLIPKQIYNINDPILFPKREIEYSSSIRAELNSY